MTDQAQPSEPPGEVAHVRPTRPPGEPTIHPAVGFHTELASCWDDKYKKASFRQRVRAFESLLGHAALGDQHWLDAGCGTGIFARLLATRGLRVSAVDASDAMIRQAISGDPDGATIAYQVVHGIERLPFPNACFDGVLCSSVLEYVDDPVACLVELQRVLKAEGWLLISVPNRESMLRAAQMCCFRLTSRWTARPWPGYLRYSKHQYSMGDFRRLLESLHYHFCEQTRCGAPAGMPCGRWRFMGALNVILAQKLDNSGNHETDGER